MDTMTDLTEYLLLWRRLILDQDNFAGVNALLVARGDGTLCVDSGRPAVFQIKLKWNNCTSPVKRASKGDVKLIVGNDGATCRGRACD